MLEALIEIVCGAIDWLLYDASQRQQRRFDRQTKSLRRARRVWQCKRCEYDLRGTLQAGRAQCPECGAPVTSRQQEFAQQTQAEP